MHTVKTLTFNSTVAFILAGMLATTTHEVAHFGTSLLIGEKATLFPTSVELPDGVSLSHITMIAIAGPVFSLISGLVIILVSRNWGRGFLRLFWIWFGFLSAQIGFGYLFASVLSQSGDTGLVLSLLDAPWHVFALVFLSGAVGSWFILPKLYAQRMSPLVTDKKTFNQAGMYPWLLGTAVLLAIYSIIEQVMTPGSIDLFGLLAVATIGIFTPIANADPTLVKEPRVLDCSLPMGGMVGTALTVLVALGLILGLTHGLAG